MANTKEERYKQLLEGCESALLHLSGMIQGHGALVRVDRGSMRVTHASANVNDILGIDYNDALGKRPDFLGLGLEDIITKMSESVGVLNEIQVKKDGILYDVSLYTDMGGVIAEFERSPEFFINPRRLTEIRYDFFKTPDTQSDFNAQCDRLVGYIREITGFERVMLYKFLPDWSGEVTAESVGGAMGSYLGLRFPASDIPAIARNLYMINPSRYIYNTEGESVPVVALDEAVIDLTYSGLRSVAPVHVEYLSNMGVKSSFSIPVKSLGGLWGMVACHASAPVVLSHKARAYCIEVVKNYSVSVSSYRTAQKMKTLDGMEMNLNELLAGIKNHHTVSNWVIENAKAVLGLFGASGFAMTINDETLTVGQPPDISFINDLKDNMTEHLLMSDSLVILFKHNTVNVKAAGALAIQTKTSDKQDLFMCWFRPEESYEVQWAGNPDKPISEDPAAIALSPRKSFETWVEVRRGYCRPWSGEDRTIAYKLINILPRWI